MFDFGQIMEKVTGLLGDGARVQDVIGGNLSETLGNLNIDPAMLENLDIDPSLLENLPLDEAREFLANAGFDPSALADGQITEVIDRLTGAGSP